MGDKRSSSTNDAKLRPVQDLNQIKFADFRAIFNTCAKINGALFAS